MRVADNTEQSQAGSDSIGASPASAEGPDREPVEAGDPWGERIALALRLWEAGNNAELRVVLRELAQAPVEEKAVHQLVQDMQRRLRPDPLALAIWLFSVAVFFFVTYWFVIR